MHTLDFEICLLTFLFSINLLFYLFLLFKKVNIFYYYKKGALTSKPYAFKNRSWELKSFETIDVLDSLGSNIKIDVRGDTIMRILPRSNININEEWITDKTRFSYDGLKSQRLQSPLLKNTINNFIEISWEKAFKEFYKNLPQQNFNVIKGNLAPYFFLKNKANKAILSNRIYSILGKLIDIEVVTILKELFNKLGTCNIVLGNDSNINIDWRSNYIFNSNLVNLEASDAILLINFNPELDLPLLNNRLRKAYLEKFTKIAIIGECTNLTYPCLNLGNNAEISLIDLAKGKNNFCKILKKAQNPKILISATILNRADSQTVLFLLNYISKKLDIKLDFINLFASEVGIYELGINKTFSLNESNYFIYNIGYDEKKLLLKKNCYIVYQGHHGDIGAESANLIFPSSTFIEKTSSFMNLEGKTQLTKFIFFPPGQAREDWTILKALSDFLDKNLYVYTNKLSLPYFNIKDIRKRFYYISSNLNLVESKNVVNLFNCNNKITLQESHCLNILLNTNFLPIFNNFYFTNSITRASTIMGKCSNFIYKDKNLNF
uniref:NADH dehydrogenase subunit 11 n=1 Tax=Glaucocystis nostochinearum TaxID=38271 RepID=E9P6C0_9EUKA|nr:NADH dehydrogenase subunit 11 [Glaucocystis nostochinearum]ADW83104.1 NADH dehydrogenase subunit 11 [Glaucocystis nostochinearum]